MKFKKDKKILEEHMETGPDMPGDNAGSIIDSSFDYSALNIETQEFVRCKEAAIKARTTQTIIDNGRDLMEVKDRLKHGQFQEWVKTNFPWTLRTAQKMMQVAENFKSEPGSLLDIPAKALYLLAAPSTPESARRKAVSMAESGETVTHKKAKELADAHKKIADLEFVVNNNLEAADKIEAKLKDEIEALKKSGDIDGVKKLESELKAQTETWKAEKIRLESLINELENRSEVIEVADTSEVVAAEKFRQALILIKDGMIIMDGKTVSDDINKVLREIEIQLAV